MGRATHLETAENDGGPDEPEEIGQSLMISIHGGREAGFARVLSPLAGYQASKFYHSHVRLSK